MQRILAIFVVGLLALGTLGGCATRYLDYRPEPASLEYRFDGTQASALTRVVGVRPVAEGEDKERGVLVQMRVSNEGPKPVTLEAEGLELVSGDLQAFEPPRLEPAGPVTVEPGASRLVEALFPYPAGIKPDEVDLDSLRLGVTLRADQQQETRRVLFRERDYYYDRYYGDPYPWRFQTGIGFHHVR